MNFTVSQLLRFTNGSLLQGTKTIAFHNVSTDSRSIQEGDLFVALIAERDGHQFIPMAIQKKASALLVSQKTPDIPEHIAVILVENTLQALGDIAKNIRLLMPAKVVGITGSNGKTSTKEMLASILEKHGETVKTVGNFNNLIGLPLSVFQLRKTHAFAVFEMGMNAPGEIEQLAQIAQPDIGIITSIAKAHLEGLKTIEGVAKAKAELFASLGPDQQAVINADDPHIMHHAEHLVCQKYFFTKDQSKAHTLRKHHKVLTLKNLKSKGQNGFSFATEDWQNQSINIDLPLIGEHQVQNALAAIAAALILHIPSNAISSGLQNITPEGRRMKLKTTSHDIHLIDDCYNSNPASCKAALQTLASLGKEKTKIAVIGDMLELGDYEREAHQEIGKWVDALSIDHLFAFGPLSYHTAQYAKTHTKMTHIFHEKEDIERLWDAVRKTLQPGRWILVKGSRGMQLERLSKRIEQNQ